MSRNLPWVWACKIYVTDDLMYYYSTVSSHFPLLNLNGRTHKILLNSFRIVLHRAIIESKPSIESKLQLPDDLKCCEPSKGGELRWTRESPKFQTAQLLHLLVHGAVFTEDGTHHEMDKL